MAHFLSRAWTPTSPSPSPEPSEGIASRTNDQSLGNAPNAASTLPASSSNVTQAPGATAAASATLSGVVANDDNAAFSAMTTSNVAAAQDEAEIARQVLEEKIRIGVDDLMQLAMCAGDVQPGDEDIVRMKM
jgi:hypothetical protein